MNYKFSNVAEAQVSEIAFFLKEKIQEYPKITFEGAMGVGKTTLIKNLCNQLGIDAHVSSPTYSIVNEYIGNNGLIVYHFDFFRINTLIEALDFGVEEYLSSGHICLIEWPELISPLLDDKLLRVLIEPKNNIRSYLILSSTYNS